MTETPRLDKNYSAFRSNPANDHITDGMWCGPRGLTVEALAQWKATHPEAVENILATRRSLYADEMIKIDTALLGKAKAGDPKAIQLAWARFENWSPRIEEEASKKAGGKTKTLADLIREGDG